MLEKFILVLFLQTADMPAPEYEVGTVLYPTQDACALMGERALKELEFDEPDALGYWCVSEAMAERIKRSKGVNL